jgi:hypothetical protein
MNWISFDDMEPPIGMNIIIVRGDDINIVEWGDHWGNSNKNTVLVRRDEFTSSIVDWKLHYWAPVSFFKEHLPKEWDENLSDLEPENDWYHQHKDHPLLSKIKEISAEIIEKKDEKRMVKTKYGWSSYLLYQTERLSNIFSSICSGEPLDEQYNVDPVFIETSTLPDVIKDIHEVVSKTKEPKE